MSTRRDKIRDADAVPLSERIQALSAFKELEAAVDDLGARLDYEDGALPAMAYRIPYVRTGEKPNQVIRHRVEPERLDGIAARRHAGGMIRRLQMHADQDPRTADRAPGVIAASPATLAQVGAVNRCKEQLDQAVKAIPGSRETRRQAMLGMVAYFGLLQSTRQLLTFEHRPAVVSYTWTNITSDRRVSVAAMRDYLSAARGRAPAVVHPELWEEGIEEALANLANLPANECINRRIVMAKHPRANITDEATPPPGLKRRRDGRRRTWRMFTVPMPLFYPADGEPLPEIRDLQVFDPEEYRAKRVARDPGKSKLMLETPLSVPWGLYRYKPEYRVRV